MKLRYKIQLSLLDICVFLILIGNVWGWVVFSGLLVSFLYSSGLIKTSDNQNSERGKNQKPIDQPPPIIKKTSQVPPVDTQAVSSNLALRRQRMTV